MQIRGMPKAPIDALPWVNTEKPPRTSYSHAKTKALNESTAGIPIRRTGEERECPICGAVYYRQKNQIVNNKMLYCSNACRGKAGSDKLQTSHDLYWHEETCDKCGVLYEVRNCWYNGKTHYCSVKCRLDANSTSHTPELQCYTCGEKIIKPCSKNQRFCSAKCWGVANSGESCSAWKGGSITTQCLECGAEFVAKRAARKTGTNQGRFCSIKCGIAWRLKNDPQKLYSNGSSGKREDLGNLFVRSRWEANYARYLNKLKAAGDIVAWKYEPKTFWFTGIKGANASYTPDFHVTLRDGSEEYHEVKGYMSPQGKVKLNRMAKFYPQEKVILVDRKPYTKIAKENASSIEAWEYSKDGKA